MRIVTERLILSPPGPDDAGEIFERYACDADVTRYMAWPRHRTIEDTRGFVAFSQGAWNRDGAGPLLIRAAADNRLLGSTGIDLASRQNPTVGYLLARSEWGQGFASEALAAMVRWADELELQRLLAPFHPDNAASRRVLVRGGFQMLDSWSQAVVFPNLSPDPVVTACGVRAFSR
jgi:ribosomal-protein-alanine N-acetyltransferase